MIPLLNLCHGDDGYFFAARRVDSNLSGNPGEPWMVSRPDFTLLQAKSMNLDNASRHGMNLIRRLRQHNVYRNVQAGHGMP